MSAARTWLIAGSIVLILGVAAAYTRELYLTRTIAQFEKSFPHEPTFRKKIAEYRALMQKVGAVRAQETLATLLSNDAVSHILNHESGKFLYETQGAAGIHKCTTVFADSCYHGFVSSLVLDRGIADIASFLDTCRDGTAEDQETQCAHGLGHGFLENVGYENLPHALDLCKQTFNDERRDTDACYEGVFMENNFGLFDNAPSDRWVRRDDPMYPCNESFVTSRAGAHETCWFMQSQSTMRGTQYSFLGSVEAVAAYCEKFPEGEDKETCFMGLARQIQINHKNDASKIREQCSLLAEDRTSQCIWDTAQAAYIYGARGEGAFMICNEAAAGTAKDRCFDTMFEGIAISYSSDRNRYAACDSIHDASYREPCRAWMHSPQALHF